MTITVAVLDMAGTTVADDGAVEAAFVAAVGKVGVSAESPRLPGMIEYVRATMGQSKIAVFRHLFDGDEDTAAAANAAFEGAYAEGVRAGGVSPVPGAAEAIATLRDEGVRVALTTGFSPHTQQVLLAALGWEHLADLMLAPADAGRGRPYPDLALTAMLRLGGADVRELAVVGDTTSDVESGLRAGARIVAGVLTGAHDAGALSAAGATDVLESVADLPRLVLSADLPAPTG